VAKIYLQKLQSVQNMAARMVYGVRRSEHITPDLEDLHWLPVSQRVVFKTALRSESVFMVSLQRISISVTSAYQLGLLPSQAVSICDLQRLALYWFHAPGLQLDNEVSQSTDQPHGTVDLPPSLWSPDLSESAFKRALKRTCSRPPGAIETSS